MHHIIIVVRIFTQHEHTTKNEHRNQPTFASSATDAYEAQCTSGEAACRRTTSV